MLEHFNSRVSFLDGCFTHNYMPVIYNEYIFAHHCITGEVLGFYNVQFGTGYITDPDPTRGNK